MGDARPSLGLLMRSSLPLPFVVKFQLRAGYCILPHLVCKRISCVEGFMPEAVPMGSRDGFVLAGGASAARDLSKETHPVIVCVGDGVKRMCSSP